MAKALVLDIDNFSTHEGPGIRTAVFLKGCPLTCGWCHSPESQCAQRELMYKYMRCTGCHKCISVCPQGAISPMLEGTGGESSEEISGETGGEMGFIKIDRNKCVSCFACTKACAFGALTAGGIEMTSDELMEKLRQDIPFYKNSGGGVTISGGEPLMQGDFTLEIVKRCRSFGINVILETSGFGSYDMLSAIANETAEIYYDIKLMDDAEHKKYTGVSNASILENLKKLCINKETAEKITVCVPCIPGINDSRKNIRETALFTKKLGISCINLLPYNPMTGEKYNWIDKPYTFKNLTPQSKDYMEILRNEARKEGVRVTE